MFDVIFQDPNLLWLIGIASALLSTYAYLPYVFDTLSGRTRPQRASWMIWSVLGSIALASQIYEGASASLWFAAIQVGGTVLIFILSLKHGTGGFLNRSDACVLAAAAVGVLAWALTETAVYALAITITISMMGGAITVTKAFRSPETETLTTWSASFVAATLAIVAVGGLDWVLLAYPLYLWVLNGAIVLAILLGRAHQARAPIFVPRHTKNAAQVLRGV
ncbi:hypothetical protein [uncultured Tateyamaria sp.]|uniref:hypothetical protein n=1 Tax=uncultured Tateyamaria sp. TaxID=455651 RepID=UPI00260A17AD|nr:hypothetical protein [uncultured Tateyamaria sp.]